jgi:glycerol kinase
MSKELILAIDQGTHSTRAIVFDRRGKLLAKAQQAVDLQVHSHTEIEQDPQQLLDSMQQVLQDVLGDPAVNATQIVAAGLATQRSSVVAWHRNTGAALSPVLSWQDRRTEPLMASLEAHAQQVEQRTGLRLSPHYGAGKLHWLLANSPAVSAAAEQGELLCGPLASYLLYHLLDGHPGLVDHANASRTLLWNLQERDWDEYMLGLFGVPRNVLPACRPICFDYGKTAFGNIPLGAVNGDQTAALYAQGQPPDNTIIVNIGTGAFVLLPVDDTAMRPDGLLAGISNGTEQSPGYYIEGTVNGAGAALQWAGKHLAVDNLEQQLPAWLASIEEPPLFINTIGGLGAPWWQSGPQPYFSTPTPVAAEAMVAVVESILFLLQANIVLLRQAFPSVQRIRISGGLSNLDGLCQKLANLSGLEVHRPRQVEATARGIAWQAAGCPADWPPTGAGETFTPEQDGKLHARYARFIDTLQSHM